MGEPTSPVESIETKLQHCATYVKRQFVTYLSRLKVRVRSNNWSLFCDREESSSSHVVLVSKVHLSVSHGSRGYPY